MSRIPTRAAAWLLSLSLAACLLAAPLSAAAAGEASAAAECTVIGEDLTNAQTAAVYETFGFSRGSVRELLMTNAEEREQLEGAVEDALIGKASCCCVYFALLPEGSGTEISVSNVTWCTEEMYRAALSTAGIEDVRAVITAPFEVSGAAALPEMYKAWEALTGQTLDPAAGQVGIRELAAMSGLAGDVGGKEAAGIVEKIRSAMTRTADLSDQELDARIRELGEQYGVKFNDAQVRQLMDLCRGIEKLADNPVTEKIDSIKDTVEKIEEFNEKKEEIQDNVSSFTQKLKDFFSGAADFFSGLFRKK